MSRADIPPLAPIGVAARCGLGLLASACAGVLLVGASLRPHPSGIGTHTQLGLPPCAFKMVLGRPCPSCGLTTSVSHFARGEWASSFRVHPVGPLFGLATAGVAVWAAWCAVQGRWRLVRDPLGAGVVIVWTLVFTTALVWLLKA